MTEVRLHSLPASNFQCFELCFHLRKLMILEMIINSIEVMMSPQKISNSYSIIYASWSDVPSGSSLLPNSKCSDLQPVFHLNKSMLHPPKASSGDGSCQGRLAHVRSWRVGGTEVCGKWVKCHPQKGQVGCFQKLQIPNKSVKWIINGNTISWGCARYRNTLSDYMLMWSVIFIHIGKSQGCKPSMQFWMSRIRPSQLATYQWIFLDLCCTNLLLEVLFSPNCLTNSSLESQFVEKNMVRSTPPIPCGESLAPPPHQLWGAKRRRFLERQPPVMPGIKFVGSNRETKIWVFQGYMEQNPKW